MNVIMTYMKVMLFLFLSLLLNIHTKAQSSNCQLLLYETYEDYRQDKYTCWEIVSFKSFFNGNRRLKLRGPMGVEKVIKENYWGCLLDYHGRDSLGIKQLFRFSWETGSPLAYQESYNGYVVYFQFLNSTKKPFKVISRSLKPIGSIVDEFQRVTADGIRIALGKDEKGNKLSRAERKKLRNTIRSIHINAEVMKLKALLKLD